MKAGDHRSFLIDALSMSRSLLIALLLATWGLTAPLRADESPTAKILSAQIGFDGYYKVGAWTPVEVAFHAEAGERLRLDVWTEDSDGAPTRYSKPLPAGQPDAPRRETLIIKPGRAEGSLRVVIRQAERVLTERTFIRGERGDLPASIARGEYLVLAVGECQSLRRTLQEQPRLRALGVHLAELADASLLPTGWQGYDGVDFVFLLGSQPATAALLADDARVDALSLWLRQGGHTIFSLGAEGKPFFADDAAPRPGLELLAPGRFERMFELRDSAALEVFAGVSEPLLVRGSRTRARLQMPLFAVPAEDVAAHSDASAADLPLIVRQSRGFGEATFVALDLNEPMLDVWSGTAPFITRLLFPDIQDAKAVELRSGRVSHLGYDDLAGQLRSALGQFQQQGVRFLPFGLFAGLMVFYLLLIGPGDYLLLKRFLPRMEYTWITFGLIVLVTCSGSVWLARWAKGDAWHRNKVDLVDIDVASGFARGRTWFALFSPESAKFDLQLSAGDDAAASLAWMGLPGAGLGGMESTAAPPLFAAGYDVSTRPPRLDDVPLQIWSTKNFTGTWFPKDDFGLRADLRRVPLGLDETVEGSVANRSDNRWTGAVLLFDRWVIPLGAIAPGETVAIDERTASLVADQHFARRRRVGDEDVVTVYDKASLDVPRIMEVLMFHQAAGGQEYTRLKHQDEGQLDFSRLLSPRRAILLVQSEQPAVDIEQTNIELTEDNSQQWTFLRFVIPVSKS